MANLDIAMTQNGFILNHKYSQPSVSAGSLLNQMWVQNDWEKIPLFQKAKL